MPEAPLPDTSPLRVDGISGGTASSKGGQTSMGGSSSQPALGLGGPREDYDAEGSEAPKDVEALRERLRQKDALG